MKITESVIKEFAKKLLKLIRITNVSFHIETLNDTNTTIPITTAFTNPFAKQGLTLYKLNAVQCYFLIKSPGRLKCATQSTQPLPPDIISISP